MSELDTERKDSTFNPVHLTYFLDGDKETTLRRQYLRSLVEQEPLFNRQKDCFMSRKDRWGLALQRLNKAYELIKKYQLNETDASTFKNLIDELFPVAVHESMFVDILYSQCSEEQLDWAKQAKEYKIVGTYAQTELGHGTNVRGLETTATLDKTTDEFILDSPTLSSLKWWPGGLAKTCTHCVVMARMIIDGKDYGIQAFLLQMRDLDSHKLLPGITTGDIGPKMGFNTIDNGYLKMDKVRIPRTNMLMRFAKVSKDGKFVKPPHDKISYGTMVQVRTNLVFGAHLALAKAITIAVRYSCVRRQGNADPKSNLETKLMDYQMQQYRLFPMLAQAYALYFNGLSLRKLFLNLREELQQGNVESLPEVHATTAGLKALATTLAGNAIEECRKACGGHGFSMFSGLPLLYFNYIPAVTYEGDNYVLYQQTGRYLVKALGLSLRKGKLSENVKYFENILSVGKEKFPAQTDADYLNPDIYLKAFGHRALRLSIRVGQIMKTQKIPNVEKLLQVAMVDVIAAAQAHCWYIVIRNFAQGLQSISDPNLRATMKTLCDLLALNTMELQMKDFALDGYINNEQAEKISELVKALLPQVRKNAVALVDAFDLSDYQLNSALGRYDGKVYETMFEWTKDEPLNQTEVADAALKWLRTIPKL